MPIVYQGLNGQLANAPATLYTCPASTKAGILKIYLVNKTSTNRLVNIAISRASGTARSIVYLNLWGGDPPFVEDGLTVLEAGDVLQGSADSATSVDYDISIFEET